MEALEIPWKMMAHGFLNINVKLRVSLIDNSRLFLYELWCLL